VPVHEETETFTAKQLGIPMPFPTVKPLVVALSMVIMFCGLLFMRTNFTLSLAIIIGGAAAMVAGLYSWLTSPLE
jgi:membrane-bound ClpP family serine protease